MKPTQYPESGKGRKDKAIARRIRAAQALNDVTPHLTASNGDNATYDDTRLMAFTKGLPHQPNGIIENDAHFDEFETELTQPGAHGETQPEFMVTQAASKYLQDKDGKLLSTRVWESPLAGMAYENEGPDPDMVAIAPAPKLGESELCAEMVENYAMALVRDIPFSQLDKTGSDLVYVNHSGKPGAYQINGVKATVDDLVEIMNSLNWFKSRNHVTTSLGSGGGMTGLEQRRQKARGANVPNLSVGTLFRGSSPGCKDGPYISQFLLQGAGGKAPGGAEQDAKDGHVQFGAQTIDQRVFANKPGVDWMTNWIEWLAVQDGTDLKKFALATNSAKFIQTPRDLATYVHVDQLYQSYFVACLMLLSKNDLKNDPGFPEPNKEKTRHPFATFGGPHILSQLTEVASRALRAVRRQKFQIHRRARPERLGAMVTLACNDMRALGDAKGKMKSMLDELGLGETPTPVGQIMEWISELNTRQNDRNRAGYSETAAAGEAKDAFTPADGKNFLLPMAFPEGSPMHPAYGAGHATVAGACTTVLKAFFGLYDIHDDDLAHKETIKPFSPIAMADIGFGAVLEANKDGGTTLVESAQAGPLTVEGELNKLAANIAIGRNFAGVHYYTDYYDSLRMGERVAIGVLKEHLMMHPEPVAMHLRSFDNDCIYIFGDGSGTADVCVWDHRGRKIELETWWNRDTSEFAKRPSTGGPGLPLIATSASNWDVTPA